MHSLPYSGILSHFSKWQIPIPMPKDIVCCFCIVAREITPQVFYWKVRVRDQPRYNINIFFLKPIFCWLRCMTRSIILLDLILALQNVTQRVSNFCITCIDNCVHSFCLQLTLCRLQFPAYEKASHTITELPPIGLLKNSW